MNMNHETTSPLDTRHTPGPRGSASERARCWPGSPPPPRRLRMLAGLSEVRPDDNCFVVECAAKVGRLDVGGGGGWLCWWLDKDTYTIGKGISGSLSNALWQPGPCGRIYGINCTHLVLRGRGLGRGTSFPQQTILCRDMAATLATKTTVAIKKVTRK